MVISLIVMAAIVVAVLVGLLFHSLTCNPVTSWESASVKYPQTKRVPIVVSLTTTPKRLQGTTIKKVLASVMTQNPAPQAIEMNIPYVMKRLGTKYTVPQWLIDSLVEIHRCDDLGSATKYVSTLQRYAVKNPDQKVLVIDDDMIMPPGLVGAASASMDAHPDSAVCGHGMVLKNKGTPRVKFSLTNYVSGQKSFLRGFSQHKQSIRKADDVQSVDIVTGYQGFGVRPRFFEMTKLADYADLPPEAVFVDDMVISARLAERQVRRIVCGSWKPFTMENSKQVGRFIGEWLKSFFVADFQTDALSSGVNRSDHNNNIVVRHFWQVW